MTVGAAAKARKLYSEIKGTKKKRPSKIVAEVVGKTVGRFFKCRYHDVGYGGQDYYDTLTTRMMKATCANLKDLWRIMKRYVLHCSPRGNTQNTQNREPEEVGRKATNRKGPDFNRAPPRR